MGPGPGGGEGERRGNDVPRMRHDNVRVERQHIRLVTAQSKFDVPEVELDLDCPRPRPRVLPPLSSLSVNTHISNVTRPSEVPRLPALADVRVAPFEMRDLWVFAEGSAPVFSEQLRIAPRQVGRAFPSTGVLVDFGVVGEEGRVPVEYGGFGGVVEAKGSVALPDVGRRHVDGAQAH